MPRRRLDINVDIVSPEDNSAEIEKRVHDLVELRFYPKHQIKIFHKIASGYSSRFAVRTILRVGKTREKMLNKVRINVKKFCKDMRKLFKSRAQVQILLKHPGADAPYDVVWECGPRNRWALIEVAYSEVGDLL